MAAIHKGEKMSTINDREPIFDDDIESGEDRLEESEGTNLELGLSADVPEEEVESET